jgi:hypothetical protein
LYIYRSAVRTGIPPSVSDTARALVLPEADAAAAYERLAAGRAIVLRPGTHDILMAPPLSSVPTPFRVDVAGRRYFGNCIWDALGIPVMLGADGLIEASCGDCGATMRLRTAGPRLVGAGVVHFAIPVRRWWEDIVHT